MFSTIWHTFFFDPIYNALVFFISVVPGGDVGIALAILTVLIKVILLPLSLKVVHMQRAMRKIEPRLKEIKEMHKDDKVKQSQEMMALYREEGVNPLASFGVILIQMPIIIALYFSVYKGGGVPLPEINTDLLYSFLPRPETVSMLFLGVIDIASRSIPLAFFAGATQFLHTRLSLPKLEPRDPKKEQSFKDDLARSMQMQMRYMLPLIIFFFSMISGVIALYFTVSNLAAIAQEYFVRFARPEKDKP